MILKVEPADESHHQGRNHAIYNVLVQAIVVFQIMCFVVPIAMHYNCTVTLMISVMYTSKVNCKLIHLALSFIFLREFVVIYRFPQFLL